MNERRFKSCRKKQAIETDVVAAARDRIRICFNEFDKVVVSFSGGKDSTAVLNLAIEVARELDRLPVEAMFLDEECLPTETVEYMHRVNKCPDVDLRWICLPTELRNACSSESPNWYSWDPACPELWTRQPPDFAITLKDHPDYVPMPVPETGDWLYGPEFGTVCFLLGIRTQESMTRFRSIAAKNCDPLRAFMTRREKRIWQTVAYPIYDWTQEDVWLAPQLFGWDYNRAYDLMAKTGLPLGLQRVSPAFGEQPIRGLWRFKVCWPHEWEKMVYRVPGAATAARYANTELYGHRSKGNTKDVDHDIKDGQSYRELCLNRLPQLSPESQHEISQGIKSIINTHRKFTPDPLPDKFPHDRSGFCWRQIFMRLVQHGSNKFNRQTQAITKEAITHRVRVANEGTSGAQQIAD